MTSSKLKIRLFVECDLAAGAEAALTREQAHYLGNVMRLKTGDEIALFNGRDGEWRAAISGLSKSAATVKPAEKLRDQIEPPDLHLFFAPIKKARTDFIAEKAAEMGARALRPVFTRFTNSERVKEDRLRAHGIEAAEQCGLLTVPDVLPATRLDRLLAEWDSSRRIMFCDETADHGEARAALAEAGEGPWAILIGPEGGFAPDEVAKLRSAPFATPVSLGPRILRADTAAVAAMTLWQSALGDWR